MSDVKKVNNKKFTVSEICTIITAVTNTNISLFKYNDLEIWIGQKPLQELNPHITPEEKTISKKFEEDEGLRELEYENLMINDPLEYEKMHGSHQ
jgi:hypothetical protein